MSILFVQVYVLRDYYLSVLSLEWREWMTNEFTTDYFKDRSFYQVQAGNLVDNPDQRITNDVRQGPAVSWLHSYLAPDCDALHRNDHNLSIFDNLKVRDCH